MIEVRIPKEINKYEAKFIGPFTLRQSVALLIALPISVILFNLCRKFVSVDVAGFVCIIPAGIAFLFGWFQPYGLKFEKFLQGVFISAFVAPSKRKYCTENYYSIIAGQIQNDEKAALEQMTKGKKKAKYKRSKLAIK